MYLRAFLNDILYLLNHHSQTRNVGPVLRVCVTRDISVTFVLLERFHLHQTRQRALHVLKTTSLRCDLLALQISFPFPSSFLRTECFSLHVLIFRRSVAAYVRPVPSEVVLCPTTPLAFRATMATTMMKARTVDVFHARRGSSLSTGSPAFFVQQVCILFEDGKGFG